VTGLQDNIIEVEGKGGKAPHFFSIGLPPFLLGDPKIMVFV